MNLRLRLAIEWMVIGLLASALVSFAYYWRGTDAFDNLLYDRLSATARPSADPDILIVTIDDSSLKTIGKWPWPRDTHARVMDTLQKAKARSITLDVLLSETSMGNGDRDLATAMAGPTPVIMPLHFSTPGSNGRAYDPVLPASIFAKSVHGIGHVNLEFDSDGIVRRTALCFDPDATGERWPHVMELAYRIGRGAASPAYRGQECGVSLLIPYAKRGSFAEIPFAELMNGQVPADLITGRDVIIGATATGMGDNFPVPFIDGGLLPGAEIMANMLTALNHDTFIAPAPSFAVYIFSLVPLWLLLIGFLRWRPRTALIVSLILASFIFISSGASLIMRLWLPPGAALLGILLVYPLWGWRRLQAMSDFMESELGALEQEGEASPLPIRANRTTDLVGRQSEALAGAIDHMRDLRRFVADTLADLPDPMFVTDPRGRVTLSNDLLNERLEHDIVGMELSAALDKIVAPDSRVSVDRYLANPNAAGEFVRFVSPANRTFVLRRAPVESNNGELRGHIHYLADITALASAETEREQVLQLLSHDMRAPQSAIIALLAGKIDGDARKRIERNARRTMQLAQDFVDLARMGETAFVGDDILLADLIRDVADTFWPLAKERGITINVEDQSDAGFVRAEPDSLSRAFANLVDNAIKFSPDGGLISATVARSGLNLTVAICDQGVGIDPEILPRLFSRFTTSDNQKGRAKGTGLGLTFVLAVIERHHGSVTARNIVDGGCCFAVTLPEAAEGECV